MPAGPHAPWLLRALSVLLALGLLTTLQMLSSPPALAAALAVAPVRIDLSNQIRSARIDVQNNGDHIMFVQVDAQAWSHDEHGDRFSPTDQLAFNPPLFRLAPGERQILRVGLRSAGPSSASTASPAQTPGEQAFRLFLTEVSKAGPNQDGVSVNMRIGLPVFIAAPPSEAGASPSPQGLAWSLRSDGRHQILTLENQGRVHVKIGDLLLEDGGANPLQLRQGAYCLAGSVRRWRLPAAIGPAAHTLRTEIDGRPYTVPLHVATP